MIGDGGLGPGGLCLSLSRPQPPTLTSLVEPQARSLPPWGSSVGGVRSMRLRNVGNPNHWRDRAAQMRALALTMKDPEIVHERSGGRL